MTARTGCRGAVAASGRPRPRVARTASPSRTWARRAHVLGLRHAFRAAELRAQLVEPPVVGAGALGLPDGAGAKLACLRPCSPKRAVEWHLCPSRAWGRPPSGGWRRRTRRGGHGGRPGRPGPTRACRPRSRRPSGRRKVRPVPARGARGHEVPGALRGGERRGPARPAAAGKRHLREVAAVGRPGLREGRLASGDGNPTISGFFRPFSSSMC